MIQIKRGSLLILYEGAFADDGGFPRTVDFPVSPGIDVNQAALTPDGRYLRQPYTGCDTRWREV